VTDRRPRILVVEDEGIIALELEHHLRDLGYEVVGTVATGAAAVAKAASLAPDVVLMDISLRGAMDGVEAARQIRAARDVPVVFLSAYADRATVDRAAVVSPFGVVTKPYDPAQLAASLETALRVR